MDSPFEGVVLDPVKCSKLSMEERRAVVYELANWSHGAAEMLQSWSRQDILQILCSEMGKERKYTGLTKLKIIEQLLKVVSEKKSGNQNDGFVEQQSSPANGIKASKRPRKLDNPSLIPVSSIDASASNGDVDLGNVTYCKNAACKARLRKEDKFCKRCSCCICHKYDDNKDPSLWLICSSEPPFAGDSCNMSCHLECAIKHKRSGIARNGLVSQLDGSFYCVSCGKMNDLMRCWRKQLVVAKDTRRVDILCYRVALSQKLLAGTKKYLELSEIMDDVVKRLEVEVGTLTGTPVKMGRGIVNRLNSGQEIQRLVASAVASFDSMLCCTQSHQAGYLKMASIVQVEDIGPTSVTVVLGPADAKSENNLCYTLWHYKADDSTEKTEPTCTLLPPQTKFMVSGLSPATEYIFKVTSSSNSKELASCEVRVTTLISTDDEEKRLTFEISHSPATNCSTLSNPSSVEDETNNIAPCSDSYISYYKGSEKTVDPNLSNEPFNSTNISREHNPSSALEEDHVGDRFGSTGQSDAFRLEVKPLSEVQNGPSEPAKEECRLQPCMAPEHNLPITPCRLESSKVGTTKKKGTNPRKRSQDENDSGKVEEANARSSFKKQSLEEREDEDCPVVGQSDGNLKHYIKVIRLLECEGHIDKVFRQNFLTWYSIRATPQEIRIVKAFVDTLMDDPASLSEQLQDTFGEIVSSKRSSVVPPGFCLKLWH